MAGNINGTLFPPLEQKFVFGNGSQHLEAFVRHSKAAAKDFVESWIVKMRILDVHVIPSRSRYVMCHGGQVLRTRHQQTNTYRERMTTRRNEITSKVRDAMMLKTNFVFLP